MSTNVVPDHCLRLLLPAAVRAGTNSEELERASAEVPLVTHRAGHLMVAAVIRTDRTFDRANSGARDFVMLLQRVRRGVAAVEPQGDE